MTPKNGGRIVGIRPDEVEVGDPVRISTATRAMRFFITMGPSDDLRMPLCRWDDDGEPMGREGIPEHQWVLDSIFPTGAPTRVVLRRLRSSGDESTFQRIDDVFDISIDGNEFVVTGRVNERTRQVRFPIVDNDQRFLTEKRVKDNESVETSNVCDVGTLIMGPFPQIKAAEPTSDGLGAQCPDLGTFTGRP